MAGNWRFPENSVLEKAKITLGFEKSPQYESSDENYIYNFGSGAGLASTSGSIRLYLGDELVDEVCWGKADCGLGLPKFATDEMENFSLMRCDDESLIDDANCLELGEWYQTKYYPNIDEQAMVIAKDTEEEVGAKCQGLIFTEIYSYFESNYSEQFVELLNPTDEIIELKGCAINYKNQNFELDGQLEPGQYYVYQNPELKLTKNPSTENVLSLIDVNGEIVDELRYPKGQKKGSSYILIKKDDGSLEWEQSYKVTPGTDNIYQEFKSCPTGKIINPDTGNCVNLEEQESLVECPPGKYRNPLTNRCKSYETTTASLTPCPEGYYRNPETNRCKKIASETKELEPCPEGYERNPETNRCRKIRINEGADYAVKPTEVSDSRLFVAYGAVAVLILCGIFYIVFQFRKEICVFMKKIRKNVQGEA